MEWVLAGVIIVQALTVALFTIRLRDLEVWVERHVRDHGWER